MITAGVVGVSDVDPFTFVGLYKDEGEAGVGLFRYEGDPPFTTPSCALACSVVCSTRE